MASLYKKVISGRPYWYLREMGWVDGKPKMVSARYVGTAAAAWGLLSDLGAAAVIDGEAGAAPPGLPLSPGTYLALAALNRAVDPCSKRAFADWWRTTAADRFTKIPASVLDHRRFWDAFHAVPLEALPRIEEKLALAACARSGLDTSSVALDMTNFATFIDTGNGRAPIAQRGKAQQKRADLRLAGTDLRYVGSVPASDCRDLLAVPADARTVVDEDRFGQLTAYDTRRVIYGTERRAILTHSPELHAHQARGFDGTTLAKATRQLDELAATLARGKTRRPRPKVEAEITKITHDAWVRRVITWELTGDTPRDLRLIWSIDAAGRAALEQEIFGKHVLITDHDDWPAAEVIAGYRSRSEAESSFRQLKDPHVVSFSPMHHWTEHNIRVHVFTCVLALQIAHLMRLKARRAGLDLSVRELLSELAGIGETVLLYQAGRGRPRLAASSGGGGRGCHGSGIVA